MSSYRFVFDILVIVIYLEFVICDLVLAYKFKRV